MHDQIQDLQLKTKEFLEAAAKVNKEYIVFISLLLEGIERLAAEAKAMESGTCPLSNPQEVLCALDLLCAHTALNEIHILLVPERGSDSLLTQPFFETFLSKLLQADFVKRVRVQVSFVARDLIQFAVSARVFQLAKEIARAGVKVEIWEMEEEKQRACIEQILFFQNCHPVYVLTVHQAAEYKDIGITLSTDGRRLNLAAAGGEASLSGVTSLQMGSV